jgi:hypothetical protein
MRWDAVRLLGVHGGQMTMRSETWEDMFGTSLFVDVLPVPGSSSHMSAGAARNRP